MRARLKRLVASVVVHGARMLASATLWYFLLALSGVLTLSYGVAIQFGRGYGLIAFGAIAILGSEAIRRGLSRA